MPLPSATAARLERRCPDPGACGGDVCRYHGSGLWLPPDVDRFTMSDVVYLNTVTKLDLPAARVLSEAQGADLEDVVICGYDEGGEFYFASNKANGAEALWLLQLAIHKLMKIGNGE
jgi:hypothetical protein